MLVLKQMKKILLLTYFFPPGNFAGSYRMASWATHLNKFGYYPVIITRHWDPNQSEFTGASKEEKIVVEKNNFCEVHYLPYHASLRDRLVGKKGFPVFLRKFLSFNELIFDNFFLGVVSYRNLYYYSEKYLRENKDTQLIITSGRPFILFRFAYLLNKKFGTPWIADYRDPWCTNTWVNIKTNFIVMILHRYFEKRWCHTSTCFTTCSEKWRDDISKFINRPGHVIYNGYEEDQILKQSEMTEEFCVLHIGTMYEFSNVEIFINAVIKLLGVSPKPIKVIFAGITFEPVQANKIKALTRDFEESFILTDRLSKDDLLKHVARANMFLMCANNSIKGWHTTKLFDYLYYRKPILLCPSDLDVIEKIIQESHSGVIANSIDEAIFGVTSIMNRQIYEGSTFVKSDQNYITQFSRKAQTKRFAEILDKMVPNN